MYMADLEFKSNEEIADANRNAYSWLYKRSVEQAKFESDVTCLWVKTFDLKPEVTNLGEKVAGIYTSYYSSLKNPSESARKAIKYFWLAQRNKELMESIQGSAALFSNVEGKKYAEKYEAALGVNRKNGWTFWKTLCPRTLENSPLEYEDDYLGGWGLREFFDDYCISDIPNSDWLFKERGSLFSGLALYWFCAADELMAAGDSMMSISKLCNAFMAISDGNVDEMRDFMYEMEDENKSKNASDWAKLRHAKTYEKRQQIINHWRENISPDKSNEFAAELLQKKFPDMATRTLARYVAEAKKLPPASTL
jgi:hypothetical protein